MENLTLEQAVANELEYFLAHKKIFSSWDITTTIRSKVTEKKYDVIDCKLFSDSPKFNTRGRSIRHGHVKKILKTICEQRSYIIEEYQADHGFINYRVKLLDKI